MKPVNVTRRDLGLVGFAPAFEAMTAFTAARTAAQADEIWLLEHPPVFTLGRAGREEHVLAAGGIPVVHTDRGGQVTYHGPGQLVAYVLADVKRLNIGPRELVRRLEEAMIRTLAGTGIIARRRPGAPGVYFGAAKIGALGLRIRRGCSYHGLALNVDVDLEPFARINPCGYAGLEVTRVADLAGVTDPAWLRDELFVHLCGVLYEECGFHAVVAPRESAACTPRWSLDTVT